MSEKLKSWPGIQAGQWLPRLVVLFTKLQFPQAGWVHPLADLCPCQGKQKNNNSPKLSLPLGWCLVSSLPKYLINDTNLLTPQDTFKMMSFRQETSTNPVIDDALPLQVQKHTSLFGSLTAWLWVKTLTEWIMEPDIAWVSASFSCLVGSGAAHITLLRLRWLICTMEINLQLFSRTAYHLILMCSGPFKQFVNCELLYKYSFNEYEIIFPSYLAVTLAKSLKSRLCSVHLFVCLECWAQCWVHSV